MVLSLSLQNVVYCFMEHRRRFSSHDVSKPSKLAFSYDVKYRLNVELLIYMSAFRILSLLVAPFIGRRTITQYTVCGSFSISNSIRCGQVHCSYSAWNALNFPSGDKQVVSVALSERHSHGQSGVNEIVPSSKRNQEG